MENDIILKFFRIEHRIAATTSYVSDIIRTKGYIGNNAKNPPYPTISSKSTRTVGCFYFLCNNLSYKINHCNLSD